MLDYGEHMKVCPALQITYHYTNTLIFCSENRKTTDPEAMRQQLKLAEHVKKGRLDLQLLV
jgi:hypothetical protein